MKIFRFNCNHFTLFFPFGGTFWSSFGCPSLGCRQFGRFLPRNFACILSRTGTRFRRMSGIGIRISRQTMIIPKGTFKRSFSLVITSPPFCRGQPRSQEIDLRGQRYLRWSFCFSKGSGFQYKPFRTDH